MLPGLGSIFFLYDMVGLRHTNLPTKNHLTTKVKWFGFADSVVMKIKPPLQD